MNVRVASEGRRTPIGRLRAARSALMGAWLVGVVAGPALAQMAPAPLPSEAYAYRAEGRRDPFVSLVRHGGDAQPAVRGPGLAALGVNDIALKGVIRSEGAFVAMVQAPDNKTYLIREQDRLRDATVKAITGTHVVFMQQVTDPLSLVKEREVRKPLRSSEEAK